MNFSLSSDNLSINNIQVWLETETKVKLIHTSSREGLIDSTLDEAIKEKKRLLIFGMLLLLVGGSFFVYIIINSIIFLNLPLLIVGLIMLSIISIMLIPVEISFLRELRNTDNYFEGIRVYKTDIGCWLAEFNTHTFKVILTHLYQDNFKELLIKEEIVGILELIFIRNYYPSDIRLLSFKIEFEDDIRKLREIILANL